MPHASGEQDLDPMLPTLDGNHIKSDHPEYTYYA